MAVYAAYSAILLINIQQCNIGFVASEAKGRGLDPRQPHQVC